MPYGYIDPDIALVHTGPNKGRGYRFEKLCHELWEEANVPCVRPHGSSGCASLYDPQAEYDVGLSEVERPVDAADRYGAYTLSEQDVEGVGKYVFEDDLISVIWIYTPKQLAFDLENKTDHTLRILWDDASFISPSGQGDRVMHAGVKYADRSAAMPPTVVPRKASVSDIVLPSDNVYFVSGQYGGWRTRSLLPSRPVEGFHPTDMVGKTMSILLPIEVEGVKNDYIFTFEILDASMPEDPAE